MHFPFAVEPGWRVNLFVNGEPSLGVKEYPGKPLSELNEINSSRYRNHLHQNVWIEILDSQNEQVGWVSGQVIGVIDPATGHYPIIRTSEGSIAIMAFQILKVFDWEADRANL